MSDNYGFLVDQLEDIAAGMDEDNPNYSVIYQSAYAIDLLQAQLSAAQARVGELEQFVRSVRECLLFNPGGYLPRQQTIDDCVRLLDDEEQPEGGE